ncbi:amidohydrolase [Devosia ginsengisoli]|uniref:Amidohydrolase n=1 Tax=Devosia ginsengisoli TaxID=400770 RepID=A0A5B8LYJ0_9HYPH|nr:amidohydrolase [Devosia ginsengisoli]QDZ12869.1 amidohydrolase [Devosia ginsengisoli]
MSNAEAVWDLVDRHGEEFAALSDSIWGLAELAYGEFRSSAAQSQALEAHGFAVTTGIGGLPTAVMGEAGTGGPVIAFLGEFDALPGLSQEAGIASPQPLPGSGNGHGCGHNLLGSAALLAATALKDWLAATGTPGRVRYYGCPAEEGGAGKVFMTRSGAFAGVDAAITWHPATTTRVDAAESLANTRIEFHFTGRSSHAAVAPHLGRSALDAVELMNVGANYMREHMPADARLHYALLDAGGTAPNVVQASARVIYAIRAADLGSLTDLTRRVVDIARGAALMSETGMSHRVVAAYSNMLPNPPLREAMHANMVRLGPVPFDAADRDFAAAIQATLTPEHIAGDFRQIGRAVVPGLALFDDVVGLNEPIAKRMSSTDVADVSWVVPTVEGRVATHAIGTPPHTWQITAQGKAPAAHKGLIHAAKVMAGTGADLIADAGLLHRVREDHRSRLATTPYQCPIPDGVQPPVVAAPKETDLD